MNLALAKTLNMKRRLEGHAIPIIDVVPTVEEQSTSLEDRLVL